MTTPLLEHSPLGASSMHRWSVCAGSIRAQQGCPEVESPYAFEGSCAHELAAQALTHGKNPNFFLGAGLTYKDRPFDVTKEMAEAVEVYYHYCKAQAGVHLIEHRFDLSAVYPGCFGTADFVAYDEDESLLHVVDYKHGAGKMVEAKGNLQLRYYALGAVMTLPSFRARRVKMTIVQPRCDHPEGVVRSDTMDTVDLLDFAADLVMYAEKTKDPFAPLVPGDHCQFCRALPTCPEYQKRTQMVARNEFGPIEQMSLPQLAEAMAMVPLLKKWCSAIDERAYSEAMAGRKVPGYKLVDKVPRRKYGVSEMSVAQALQDAGIDDSLIFDERPVKIPAQMEKSLGKKLYAQHVEQFVVKESSGTTLVPEDDKRPEVAPNPSAQQQFSVIKVKE